MHFLAIWQRRYFLTFREQEREAGSKYSPVISVAVFLERAKQKKKHKQKNQTYFQEYQKYRLNCDTYALKPVYNMIRSLLRWSVWIRSRRCFSGTSLLLHQDRRFNQNSLLRRAGVTSLFGTYCDS